jgi:hypothetical protein
VSHAERGRSFEAVLRDGTPLSRERALGMLRGAAEAIDSFHARTGPHGSIHLRALLETGDGQVRLLPPDALSACSDDPRLRHYLSPQRLAGEPARVPDDLFALGVVAIHLLTARTASDLDSSPAANNATVPSQRVADADLPAAVKRALLTQLSTAPASRFASGTALVGELARAFAVSITSAGDDRANRTGQGTAHLQGGEAAWNRRFGPHGRLRVAPDSDLVLDELPDSDGSLSRPSRRRVSRRTDYPDLALPGALVLVIVTVLCSVYLFPLYYMLVRHL